MKFFRQCLFQVFASFFLIMGTSAWAQDAPTANEIAVLRAGAERGDANMQFVLGYRYASGEGVVKNHVEAVKWFRKSAEQGNEKAQFNLAYHCAQGAGVERNEAEALKWYRKSAEQGLKEAQYALFLHYTYGPVVMKAEAAKWLHKAAEQGHADAQANVGLRYGTGDGVVKSEVLAYMWYLLASANGNDIARKALPLMEKKLTAAQRAQGQRLAKEWQAKSRATE
jgi:TPR repeat protein